MDAKEPPYIIVCQPIHDVTDFAGYRLFIFQTCYQLRLHLKQFLLDSVGTHVHLLQLGPIVLILLKVCHSQVNLCG